MALVKYNNNSLSSATSAASFPAGAMTLIKTITASSDSTISFVHGSSDVVLDSTYPIYLFKLINIHPATDNAELQFQADTGTNTNYNIACTSSGFEAYNNEPDNDSELRYDTQYDNAQSTSFIHLASEIMSVDDAKRAVDIGCTGIMVSNHGGRQLDGSRSPFDQLAEIVDAVGDKLDVICEGGIHRGTHMLKALSLGAKACSGGRLYLYALAAAGQAGVERALEKYKTELERDMKLMGCTKISDLNRNNLRFRK